MCEENLEKQVTEDPELLELMMRDRDSASSLYKPNNRWLSYEQRFLRELRSVGLKDFRKRKNSVLFSFGGNDLLPKSRQTYHPILKIIQASMKIRRIENLWKFATNFISGEDTKNLRLLYYQLAQFYGEKNGAKPISEFVDSLIGNPEDFFSVDKRYYTLSLLSYYCQYAYCCNFVDFNSINSYAEMGSGSGKQVEVIKKLHPEICFYVFEIPPQLYICEQYLSAVFPNSVISYRQTRTLTRVPEQKTGKIFIFGNWRIAELENLSYDLFWNSASFQELETAVVANYLKYVNAQTSKYIFLCELLKGSEHRVFDRTTLDHYKKGLKNFQLLDLSKTVLPLYTSRAPYCFSFWSKCKEN